MGYFSPKKRRKSQVNPYFLTFLFFYIQKLNADSSEGKALSKFFTEPYNPRDEIEEAIISEQYRLNNQKLFISSSNEKTILNKDIQGGYKYKVIANDTLNKISEKFNVELNEIIKLNPQITNIHKINIGDEIVISMDQSSNFINSDQLSSKDTPITPAKPTEVAQPVESQPAAPSENFFEALSKKFSDFENYLEDLNQKSMETPEVKDTPITPAKPTEVAQPVESQPIDSKSSTDYAYAFLALGFMGGGSGSSASSSVPIIRSLELIKNTLIINEGESKVISSANFDITMEDSNAIHTYSVTNLTHGQFELTTSSGNAITSFTQTNIDNGVVQFVHDDSEIAPSFSISVTDGVNTTNASATSIIFTNINDHQPILTANTLTLSEANSGEKVTITTSHIAVSDVDVGDTHTYTVSDVTNGQFELTTSPGNAITTFTPADISNQLVVFAHDGSEDAPSFKVSVSDGITSTTPAGSTINFTNVNDAPVATNDSKTLDEDTTAIINVLANDQDAEGDALSITITGAPSDGNAIVNNGKIEYTPDANFNGTDSITYSISDGNGGSDSATVSLSVNNVIDGASLNQDTGIYNLFEDDDISSVSNQISVTNEENVEVVYFIDQENLSYGEVSINESSGVWSYQINDDLIQDLDQGEHYIETFRVNVRDELGGVTNQILEVHLYGRQDFNPIEVRNIIQDSQTDTISLDLYLDANNLSDTISSIADVEFVIETDLTISSFTNETSHIGAYNSTEANNGYQFIWVDVPPIVDLDETTQEIPSELKLSTIVFNATENDNTNISINNISVIDENLVIDLNYLSYTADLL